MKNQTNQQPNKSPAQAVISADDIFIACDRLENARAVVAFLGAASYCLSSNEECMTPDALSGLNLAHQWVEDQIKTVEDFLREARI